MSEAFFPVELAGVTVNGQTAPDYISVTRADNHKVLAVHKKGYKLVPHRELLTQIEVSALPTLADTFGSPTRKIQVASDGALMCAYYTFHAVTVSPKVGDITAFRLKVVNSYDASAPIVIVMSPLRLACLNGMVTPGASSKIYSRHTAGLDLERLPLQILRLGDHFRGLEASWANLAQREITDEEAEAVIRTIPGASPLLIERLGASWATHVGTMGATSWALLNTLTAWSSHGPMRDQKEAARVVLRREAALAKVLRSPEWAAIS